MRAVGLFYPKIRIRRRRHGGQQAVLIQQDFAQAVRADGLLGIGNALHMQINPVAVRKLHQPAVAVCQIRLIAQQQAGLLRQVHIEPFAKAVNPCCILDKGKRFPHDIHNIIILKKILRRIRVCSGAIHINGPDPFILTGCI